MAGFASLLGLVLADRVGRDRGEAAIRVVATSKYASAAYAAAHPATGHSFSGLGGMFGANAPPANR